MGPWSSYPTAIIAYPPTTDGPSFRIRSEDLDITNIRIDQGAACHLIGDHGRFIIPKCRKIRST